MCRKHSTAQAADPEHENTAEPSAPQHSIAWHSSSPITRPLTCACQHPSPMAGPSPTSSSLHPATATACARRVGRRRLTHAGRTACKRQCTRQPLLNIVISSRSSRCPRPAMCADRESAACMAECTTHIWAVKVTHAEFVTPVGVCAESATAIDLMMSRQLPGNHNARGCLRSNDHQCSGTVLTITAMGLTCRSACPPLPVLLHVGCVQCWAAERPARQHQWRPALPTVQHQPLWKVGGQQELVLCSAALCGKSHHCNHIRVLHARALILWHSVPATAQLQHQALTPTCKVDEARVNTQCH